MALLLSPCLTPLPSVAFTHCCASFKMKFVILVVWVEESVKSFPEKYCAYYMAPRKDLKKLYLQLNTIIPNGVKYQSKMSTYFDSISTTSTGTTITSCFYKMPLQRDTDTLSRIQLPFSLDNNQAKDLGRLLIDCAILVTRVHTPYVFWLPVIHRVISSLLGSLCVLCVPVLESGNLVARW